ncbi:MAG TPA: hypothetical protein VHT91_32265 [Kofleriaceae bacterium]|jgi:hypothetical protein|nr:hypothetical protein [Kofleriaceae bacterium]
MHDAPTRRARAILIAGDPPDVPGVPAPGALAALATVERDLHVRFASAAIEPLIVATTKHRVLRAFDHMRGIVEGDDLVVVMFAGRGMEPDGWLPSQSWVLSRGELLTDIELATALLAFPPAVDTVVISACGYGDDRLAGARPGWLRRHRLRALARGFASRLAATWSRARRTSAMVCLSSASADRGAACQQAELATEIADAAAAGRSYAELARGFLAHAAAGRALHVDARPRTCLHDAVLAAAIGRAPDPAGKSSEPARPAPAAGAQSHWRLPAHSAFPCNNPRSR